MPASLPPARLRSLGGTPLWVPVGFRGRSLPGSGGVYDTTNNSVSDLTWWQMPSFAGVSALKLVYGGYDVGNYGPMDRAPTVTGFASVQVPGAQVVSVFVNGTPASGVTAIPISPGSALAVPSKGQTITGTGIPAGAYITSVVPTINGTAVVSGFTVNISAATTAALTNAQVLTCSGAMNPAFWGRQRSLTIYPAHDFYVSDPIPVQAAANSWVAVRGSWTFSSSSILMCDYPTATSGTTRINQSSINESSQRGIGLADTTQIPTQPSNSGGGYWCPVSLLGLVQTTAPHPAVLIIGDSIAAGTGDAADSNGRLGYVQKALGNAIPWANVARGSNSAGHEAAEPRGAYRLSIEMGVTDVLLEVGRNDINAGTGAPTALAFLQKIAAPYVASGIRVWGFTCLPTTSSTDGWATLGNQTIPNSTYETDRLSYNTSLRTSYATYGLSGVFDVAAIVEQGGASSPTGLWRVDLGAASVDGVHPSAVLHAAIVSAGTIQTSRFTA